MSSKTCNWISVIAILLSAIAILCSVFRFQIVMTHDTWIGIMSSLVGAAATLIVGTQIYSSITTRRDVEKIRSLQRELQDELKRAKAQSRGND